MQEEEEEKEKKNGERDRARTGGPKTRKCNSHCMCLGNRFHSLPH